MAFESWLFRLRVFRQNPLLNVGLFAGNMLAVYWGWTVYYAGQLDRTPWWGRLWVPDSPNAVFVFAVALILYLGRLRFAGWDLLAWIVNIKVGLWTSFVLLYYYKEFFTYDPAYANLRWWLFVLHVGMIAQAFVLYYDLKLRPLPWNSFLLVAGWDLFHDALDYGAQLHPDLPRGSSTHTAGYVFPTVTAFVTVALSLLLLLAAHALFKPGQVRQTPMPRDLPRPFEAPLWSRRR